MRPESMEQDYPKHFYPSQHCPDTFSVNLCSSVYHLFFNPFLTQVTTQRGLHLTSLLSQQPTLFISVFISNTIIYKGKSGIKQQQKG